MYQKFVVLSIVLMALFLCSYATPADAQETSNLILKIKDLTWISYRPNDDVKNVVAHFGKKYKVGVSSMANTGMNCYVAGNESNTTIWAISFEYDNREKLSGIIYSHFKLDRQGIPITTSRGIKIGSNIETVIERYGKVKEIVNPRFPEDYFAKLPYPALINDTSQPVYNYLKLTYPFLIKETSQKGELKFSVRYKRGNSRKEAVVTHMEYQLLRQ
jgi:hypothetical protein